MSEADELLPATDTRRDTPSRGAAARRADILPPIRGKAVETWYQVLEREDVETSSSLRRPVIAGTVAVLLGFGGFLGWAFSADLDSAAVATGTVVVDSKRKTVSHLEGGILKRLLI